MTQGDRSMERPRRPPGLRTHVVVGGAIGGAIALLVEPPFHDPGLIAGALLVLAGGVAGALRWRSGRASSEAEQRALAPRA